MDVVKKEIFSLIKSRRAVIITIFICACVLIDVFLVLINTNEWQYMIHPENYSGALDTKQMLHPVKASFLSGSSHGHIPQIIIIHLLPLFVLLLGSDNSVQEHTLKYDNIMLTHMSRKKYLKSKYLVSFIVPFVIVIVALLLNLIASIAVFHGGEGFRGLERKIELEGVSKFWLFEFTHPYIAYIGYIFSAAFASGLCGIICRSVALLSGKYSTTYFSGLFLWMALIISKYSVTYVYQPFSEYGWEYLVAGHIILILITLIISMISYMRKVREDEM